MEIPEEWNVFHLGVKRVSIEPVTVEIDESMREERARRIIQSTIELAEEGGFEAVRLRDVASRAEVAMGTLYRRFRSKEDLLVAALELETRILEERIRLRPPKGASAVERAVQFFAITTRGMLRRPNLTRAMLKAAAAGEPALARKVSVFHDLMLRMIVGAWSTSFILLTPRSAFDSWCISITRTNS